LRKVESRISLRFSRREFSLAVALIEAVPAQVSRKSR
jgi:hypothetical protein